MAVNACVLVNTSPKAAPRSVVFAAARFARIVHLYVDTQRDSKDSQRKRAIVEYFVRYVRIVVFSQNGVYYINTIYRPDACRLEIVSHTPPIQVDCDRELILDHRKPQPFADVALVSVVAPFNLYPSPAAAEAAAATMISIEATDLYVCRYKIIKLNGKYCLFPWAVAAAISATRSIVAPDATRMPVDAITDDKENRCKQQQARRSPAKRKAANDNQQSGTPSRQTVHQSVTPIKIVNNSVQKVHQSVRHGTAPVDQHQHFVEEQDNSPHGKEVYIPDEDDVDDDDIETTPHKRRRDQLNNKYITAKRSACKNLNESLCAGSSPSGTVNSNSILNYSIEQQDELKVKIRISDRSKRSAAQLKCERTPDFRGASDVESDGNNTPSRRQKRTEISRLKAEQLKLSNTRPANASRRSVLVTDRVQSSGPVRRSTRFSSISTQYTAYEDDDDGDNDDVRADKDFTPTTPSSKRTTAVKLAPTTPKSTTKTKTMVAVVKS